MSICFCYNIAKIPKISSKALHGNNISCMPCITVGTPPLSRHPILCDHYTPFSNFRIESRTWNNWITPIRRRNQRWKHDNVGWVELCTVIDFLCGSWNYTAVCLRRLTCMGPRTQRATLMKAPVWIQLKMSATNQNHEDARQNDEYAFDNVCHYTYLLNYLTTVRVYYSNNITAWKTEEYEEC